MTSPIASSVLTTSCRLVSAASSSIRAAPERGPGRLGLRGHADDPERTAGLVRLRRQPFNYLPGVRRPNQTLPNDQILVDNWDIGTERFIRAQQNRYFATTTGPRGNVTGFPGFEYPAAFQPGTVGRNTVQAPAMFWLQLSLSKQFTFGERYKLEFRWDLNNATKQAQFANPDTAFNRVNTANFGTFNGTRGSFSDVGTARMHHIAVLRFIW